MKVDQKSHNNNNNNNNNNNSNTFYSAIITIYKNKKSDTKYKNIKSISYKSITVELSIDN